jgi:hypothetical protein
VDLVNWSRITIALASFQAPFIDNGIVPDTVVDLNWRPDIIALGSLDDGIVPDSVVGSVTPASRARGDAVEPRRDAPAVENVRARQHGGLLLGLREFQ